MPVEPHGMMQNREKMNFIGITGGVGCGKSMVLKYLESEYGADIIYSDILVARLCEPGGECLEMIKQNIPEVFPESVIGLDGRMDRVEMGRVVFESPICRSTLNAIIHPTVKKEVCRIADEKRASGKCSLLILEAALLIEERYDLICDELWYIYSPEDLRRQRLKEHRGYSDEKITSMMASQLSDREFRAGCDVVIDNSGTKEQCHKAISVQLRKKKYLLR